MDSILLDLRRVHRHGVSLLFMRCCTSPYDAVLLAWPQTGAAAVIALGLPLSEPAGPCLPKIRRRPHGWQTPDRWTRDAPSSAPSAGSRAARRPVRRPAPATADGPAQPLRSAPRRDVGFSMGSRDRTAAGGPAHCRRWHRGSQAPLRPGDGLPHSPCAPPLAPAAGWPCTAPASPTPAAGTPAQAAARHGQASPREWARASLRPHAGGQRPVRRSDPAAADGPAWPLWSAPRRLLAEPGDGIRGRWARSQPARQRRGLPWPQAACPEAKRLDRPENRSYVG
jgi:hypothetical protein